MEDDEEASMENHSPAPWTWNERRPENYDLEWLHAADGTRILCQYGNGKMTPNKLLLAAAPDLLKEVKILKQSFYGALLNSEGKRERVIEIFQTMETRELECLRDEAWDLFLLTGNYLFDERHQKDEQGDNH